MHYIKEKHFERLLKMYDEEQSEKESLRGKDRKQQVDEYFNFVGNIEHNGKLT